MGYSAGIDGCPAGWIVVSKRDGQFALRLYPTLESYVLEVQPAGQILIDMPIGLRVDGRRLVEGAARKILSGKRSASVFSVPCRGAVYAQSYAHACKINEKITGKKISIQAWNICPKIRELDKLLYRLQSSTGSPRSQSRFRGLQLDECHPEICFIRLMKVPLIPSKKTPEGRDSRIKFLRAYLPIEDLVADCTRRYRRSEVKIDDLLDAAVLCLAADQDQLERIGQDNSEDGPVPGMLIPRSNGATV